MTYSKLLRQIKGSYFSLFSGFLAWDLHLQAVNAHNFLPSQSFSHPVTIIPHFPCASCSTFVPLSVPSSCLLKEIPIPASYSCSLINSPLMPRSHFLPFNSLSSPSTLPTSWPAASSATMPGYPAGTCNYISRAAGLGPCPDLAFPRKHSSKNCKQMKLFHAEW